MPLTFATTRKRARHLPSVLSTSAVPSHPLCLPPHHLSPPRSLRYECDGGEEGKEEEGSPKEVHVLRGKAGGGVTGTLHDPANRREDSRKAQPGRNSEGSRRREGGSRLRRHVAASGVGRRRRDRGRKGGRGGRYRLHDMVVRVDVSLFTRASKGEDAHHTCCTYCTRQEGREDEGDAVLFAAHHHSGIAIKGEHGRGDDVDCKCEQQAHLVVRLLLRCVCYKGSRQHGYDVG
mmetsp:Transcript_34336/g.88769  ORF Transcript_34336/g.88769 Transcript_34336/m.88769 type:complete len:233 (-) Transcript_34336:747-1445(-)